MRVWAVGILFLLIATAGHAGSRDDPEITDPEGDTELSWLDIRRVWIEHQDYDVAKITMEVAEFVPVPPDLRTGGMFTGPYFHVEFDLVDWNGTRIGDIEDQYVALAVEETIVLVYVCVWQHPELGGCWSNGFGRIHGRTIEWEVDIKEPEGDNRTVGSGYRFENLSAYTELRALAQPLSGDRAPDSGSSESIAEPTFYKNVQTADDDQPQAAGPGERGALTAGVAVLTGALAGIGRFVYKMGRYRILRWSLLHFLFSRIQRGEALHHKRRAAVFEAIKADPGATFSELRRGLKIGSGSLAYHLKVLEQQALVAHIRDGRRSRFYVKGALDQVGDYLSHTQRTLLETIRGNPGATPSRIAGLVGLPRHAVHYHLGRLLEVDRVRKQRKGRHVHYYA